jgi:hypothetical protein|tara:strand:+ start:108 stop:245 length:138 start_codon:yes stop_codon:yes gene_type:complete
MPYLSDELKTIFKLVKEYPNNYQLGKEVRAWVFDVQEKIEMGEWK